VAETCERASERKKFIEIENNKNKFASWYAFGLLCTTYENHNEQNVESEKNSIPN
jgi:hypothetical protein